MGQQHGDKGEADGPMWRRGGLMMSEKHGERGQYFLTITDVSREIWKNINVRFNAEFNTTPYFHLNLQLRYQYF